MARRTGAWKDSRAIEAGARKWGTGINPVNSIYGEGDPRDAQTPNLTAGGTHEARIGMIGQVPRELTDNSESAHYGDYCDDYGAAWGYSDDDGTSDRPPVGVSTEQFRGDTDLYRGSGFPAWGNYTNGIPGGSTIRDRNHGALVTKQSKEVPTETVSEGWEDKVHLDEPLNAVVSDPQQLIMNTSMMQRDRVREGSQRSGSLSVQEPAHPIRSRMVGMRIKPWSGGERHYDMFPKEQDERIRPWWSRGAGTADESLMEPNEFRPVAPVVRNPPPDPYQGADVGTTNNVSGTTYGYVSEDVLPYV